MSSSRDIERIISRLDGYLGRNDYASAERHLLFWLDDARTDSDVRTQILITNELIGLYRKLGRREDALGYVDYALRLIADQNLDGQTVAGTTYINCATALKAFGQANKSLELFEKARRIYERELEPTDTRLGGLYNNMALTLVDLRRFQEAHELYGLAISVMERVDGSAPEIAITHLNIASALEAELGLEGAETAITEHLDIAEKLLDLHPTRDGYYAFVCEKCAPVFDYYGYFVTARKLAEQSRRIYEGN